MRGRPGRWRWCNCITGDAGSARAERRAPVGPCALAPGGRYPLGVKGLSEEEILTLIDAFVIAAERAHGAGLHGVELHAAHHFLLCNFLNPCTTGAPTAGGSLANRGGSWWR